MHHQPFIAANRAGRHCQALTLPRPLEKGFLKVLGFIFLVFGCGPGAGGRVNETAAERVPRPPKKSKVPGSRFQVEVITKNYKYSNFLSTMVPVKK